MDKLIAKGKYSPIAHRKFYLFHLFYKSSSTYFTLFLITTLIILGSFMTKTAIQTGKYSSIFFIWSLVFFTIIFTILQMFLRIKKTIKEETDKRKDSIEVVEVTKDLIVRRIQNVPGREVIGWDHIESIYENKEYIYIYTKNNTGFLIIKEDIIEGNLEGFRKLAKNQMPKTRRGKVKYKVLYKEK